MTDEDIAALVSIAVNNPSLFETISSAVNLAIRVVELDRREKEINQRITALEEMVSNVLWAVSVLASYANGRPVVAADMAAAVAIAESLPGRQSYIPSSPRLTC